MSEHTSAPEGTEPSTAAATAATTERPGSFSLDVEEKTLGNAVSSYVGRLRSGEPGALPAILGLVVLVIIFSQVSAAFLTRFNIGNLPGQGAYIAIIALGLVFVLLLGEIDLSAGTAGGRGGALAGSAGVFGGRPGGLPPFPFFSL